jgi:hypothetical protein
MYGVNFACRQHSASGNSSLLHFLITISGHSQLWLISLGYSHHPDHFFWYHKLHGKRMMGPMNESRSELKSKPILFSGALKSSISNFYQICFPLFFRGLIPESEEETWCVLVVSDLNGWLIPRVLTFRETLPLFWRNFNTVASEPEGGVEVGDGHFIPDDTTPPLLWAQAEQLTQCWAEMRGLGVAVVTVISNVCFQGCRMRLTWQLCTCRTCELLASKCPLKVPVSVLQPGYPER